MTDKREIKMAFDYTKITQDREFMTSTEISTDTGAWKPFASSWPRKGGYEFSINDPKIADDIRENPNFYLVTGTVEDHIKTGRYLGILPVPGPIDQVWWVDWSSEAQVSKNRHPYSPKHVYSRFNFWLTPHGIGEKTYYSMSPGGATGDGGTPTIAELNAINEGLR